MALSIDLNADLGEGFGRWSLTDDRALLEVVTSANVACGFHAGDPLTMRRVCAGAVEHGVAIGAQVGYRDLAGFGRRVIEYDPEELAADVLYQLAALDGIARSCGGRVRYVKPHGALYNRAADDPVQASAVVSAVVSYDSSLPLLCLPGSVLAAGAAAAGIPVVGEAFADRGYTSAGRLVPRSEPNALVKDVETVAARAVRFATERATEAVDGSTVAVDAESICLHGDSASAVDAARRVRDALSEAGVTLTAFA